MIKRLISGLAIAAAVAAAIAVPPAANAQQAIRFAVTDVDGLESLQREFGPFKEAFEKAAGLKVDFLPVSGRTAAVEAMAAKQVDFVLTGPAEYVVFRARSAARPVVAWTRPDYFSQIVVLADGPIKSLADLKGKKISFGDVGSTSQHLGPAQILTDAGLTYGRDYEPLFVKINVAVEALKRGDLGAIGMNLTYLQRARRAMPDVAFRVLGRGRDLPDDLILASADVPEGVIKKVRETFLTKGPDLLKAVVANKGDNEKYLGGTFLPNIEDRDYDVVRAMYRSVGVAEFTKFIGN